MLCVTHDIGATTEFDRVVVVDAGRIVEQGEPGELSRQPGSRYRALLDAERQVHETLWADPDWRRYRLVDGTCTAAPREDR